MAMNRIHQRYCRSDKWAGRMGQLLPWALEDVTLGEDALEIGPGYGVTTKLLVPMTDELTALEVDPVLAERLRGLEGPGGGVSVVHGDGAAMPFDAGRFSSAVCFTMLHHVPSPALQDALFAETCRVLAPGGVFAGSDSLPSLRFRLIHVGDTMTLVDPRTLPSRLERAGFTDIKVSTTETALRFNARKP